MLIMFKEKIKLKEKRALIYSEFYPLFSDDFGELRRVGAGTVLSKLFLSFYIVVRREKRIVKIGIGKNYCKLVDCEYNRE